jgi:hypothetical protein
VRTVTSDPSVFIVAICACPPVWTKAMRAPSGDHEGSWLSWAKVSLCRFVPSAFIA